MLRMSGRSSMVVLAACAALFGLRPVAVRGQVKAWETAIVLPTYEVGPAEPDPIFYSGRAYQGAKGPIFPYALLDKLTDAKRDRSYRILYLENKYVRIGVLPEIGGRIFEAVDKTNGYDFVYRQHVIKPALIGMLGAWISGGVEWNIPHHHRATTFMPVDSSLETSADGSATVWVGEIELRHRMKWLVGLTLRPDSSVLEVTIKLLNRTPFAHSMLAFANVAVHANENYQILFPPSTEVATFHGKNQFSRWPLSAEVFNGQDYTRGVDVSWWKSHLTPTSFFAFDAEEDFLGGYDHGREAGVVFVGDHNVVPGKKLWTWGTGSEGKTWERILTDTDGPYLELMVGAWSDNQPDYSWVEPGEERVVTQFWYPLRGLDGLMNANREAACNLEVREGKAWMAFDTTSERKGVKALLRSRGQVLFEDTFDIGPASPYGRAVGVPAGTPEESLELSLSAADGRELIRYAPRPKKNLPLPTPVKPPAAPKDIATNEELYLAGLRLEQFHNPVIEPYPYYEEALRRDPTDARVNTALGILYLKRGIYKEAEERLRTAVVKLSFNDTRPKDGEALYYLGVALRRLGRLTEAEDAFERAAWSPAWRSVCFHEIAEMAAGRGDVAGALDFIDRALAAGPRSINTLSLKASVLRKLGRMDEAFGIVTALRRADPLDAWSLHELRLLQESRSEASAPGATRAETDPLLGNAVPNLLELALDYANAGLWGEAAAVLEPRAGERARAADPLTIYLFAYALDRLGRPDEARACLRRAAALPPDRVFPFELEFIDILEWAMKENPADARAPYALGNLLFDLQPERAIGCWEKARALDPGLSLVHRNLGLAYARVKNDLPGAVGSLERAVAANRKDARLYYDLDLLYEAAGADVAKRLALLEKNHGVVSGNDNALAREVGLFLLTGRPAKALEILTTHHFHVWEGGGEIHGIWVEANLSEGRRWLEKKDFRRGLASFLNALAYPRNLDVGPPSRGGGSPKVFFNVGLAYRGLGNADEASSYFEKAGAIRSGLSEQAYYVGLALAALGRKDESIRQFEDLVRQAHDALAAAPAPEFFEKFGERQSARGRQANLHFLAGLGLRGIGKDEEARLEFEQALAADPGHLEARRFLKKGS
jgi:tetratricopeptide (TPR) repeat protein